MKNAEKLNPAVTELNEEMLQDVNGGFALTATVLAMLTGTTLTAYYAAVKTKVFQEQKAWKEQQKSRAAASA